METRECRVVVVSHELDDGDRIVVALQDIGFRATSACSGYQGLALASNQVPDVCLIDLELRDFSGFELAKLIRATDWGSRCFLIALSNSLDNHDRLEAAFAGFDLVVTLPVLDGTIERILLDWLKPKLNIRHKDQRLDFA
jgi:DNA-binding response OmpR family regulator